MNENAGETNAAAGRGRSAAGMRYLLTVGALLVIIIALLAALWARERSWRISAEAGAVHWQRKYRQLRGALDEVLLEVPRAATAPARPDAAPGFLPGPRSRPSNDGRRK